MIDPEFWRQLLNVLGWALIHFIWQGTFVTILLAGVLRILRGRSTNARYAAACAALLLMLAAPLATMAIVMWSAPGGTVNDLSPVFAAQPESRPVAVETKPAITPTQPADVTASSRLWSSVRSVSIESSLPWIILLWLLGVIFLSLRLIGGCLYARRLRRHWTRPFEERRQRELHRLCRQLRVTRPVRLLESVMVKVPMVIGWLRPVILLPVGALTGLTAQQLEAIIAHELAHIRRHDYLINLLQSVVETLLFYHPAVWWVSRRIREERENCCDDLAVAVCGDVFIYARALLEMEQLRAVGPQLAMAANGGLLMKRIQRLVGAQTPQTNRFAGVSAGIIALTIVISVVAGAQIMKQSPRGIDRQVISIRKQETGKVNAIAETPNESNSGAADQQSGSAQEDRAADALLPALQSASGDMRKAAIEKLAQLRGDRAVELLIAALKDEHTQAREQAVIGLGIRRDERLVVPLIAALTDRDWEVREQAAIALGRVNDELVVEPLIRALVDGEWAVREQAARSLGAIGGGRAVEPLINALRDQREEAREAAAKSLGIIGDRRALEPLTQALQDVSEQVRKKAAEALGLLKQSGGESSAGAPRKPFGEQAGYAQPEPRPEPRPEPAPRKPFEEQAGVAPNRMADHQAIAESMNALRSSNPAERAAAACSLGRLGAAEAIPSLVNLLGDDAPIQPLRCWEGGHWSPAIQTFQQASPGEQAAIALASMGHRAVQPLIAALRDGSPSVRRNAAWAIGEVRGGSGSDRSAAVEPLISALNDGDSWVRGAAAFSLGEMRPREAIEPLVAALGDAEWKVREMAARALGEMKTRSGVESLAALLLRDENERVRRKAAWALGEIRDSSALDALTAALSDQDQKVRSTVKWAISEIRD